MKTLIIWTLLMVSLLTGASAADLVDELPVFHDDAHGAMLSIVIADTFGRSNATFKQCSLKSPYHFADGGFAGLPLASQERASTSAPSGPTDSHAAFVAQQHGARNASSALSDSVSHTVAGWTNVKWESGCQKMEGK